MSEYPLQRESLANAGSGQIQLSVAIVVYDSDLGLLSRTIASLHQSVSLGNADCPLSLALTLVDNSCNEDYGQRLQQLLAESHWPAFCSVNYLAMTENLGFGVAHNCALEQADSDYHVVLNPDVEMAEDAMSLAIGYLRDHPEVVLASPNATDESGANQYLCKSYPSVLVLALRAFGPEFLRRLFREQLYRYELRDTVNAAAVAPVTLVSGCCMFARTSALRSVGGFCADYFLYFEDFDLCLRLATQGQLLFLPQVRIVHHGGYSARKGWRHILMFIGSGRRFFATHGWRWI